MKKMLCGMLLAASALAQNTTISLPAGTFVTMKLETTIATYTSKTGDAFSGRVTEAVVLDGKTVIPIGSTVQGHVTRLSEPRRIEGKPTIGMRPEALVLPNGDRFVLNAILADTNIKQGTDVNDEGQFKGKGHDGKDLAEIGLGTGGGMLAGGLIGGGKGVLIGGAVGATATVAHWLSKKNFTQIPSGTELVVELSRPLEMSAVESAGQ